MGRRTLILGALCGALTACGGNEGPVAGELVVRLTTPNSTDRAVQFRLVGAQTGFTAPGGSGYRVFSASAGGDTTRVIVVAPQGGGLAPGDLVRVAVPDTRRASSYIATVQAVAGADYLLRPLGPFSLQVGP